MQDRYAGDVGDFMKLGLLRFLSRQSATPLRLGINWYLAPDESHNNDGKHVSYLDPGSSHYRSLSSCDRSLMGDLAAVVAGPRSVAALKASGALPLGAITYATRLQDDRDLATRTAWHQAALHALAEADLVFVDPDNGIRSSGAGRTSHKFAYADEIADYTSRGQSVIAYHHADRSKGGVDAQVPRRLNELAGATGLAPIGAVIARRGSVRFFLVVATDRHRSQLLEALEAYSKIWSPHGSFVRAVDNDPEQWKGQVS